MPRMTVLRWDKCGDAQEAKEAIPSLSDENLLGAIHSVRTAVNQQRRILQALRKEFWGRQKKHQSEKERAP